MEIGTVKSYMTVLIVKDLRKDGVQDSVSGSIEECLVVHLSNDLGDEQNEQF